jgi:hypothetical protein
MPAVGMPCHRTSEYLRLAPFRGSSRGLTYSRLIGPIAVTWVMGDVLARLGPVKVGRAAGQHDDAAGRVRLQLRIVELIAPADVESPGNDTLRSCP